jgi:hypothetical protein
MILGAKAPGKVGRRQAEEERDSSRDAWVFFVYVECERSTKNRRSGAAYVEGVNDEILIGCSKWLMYGIDSKKWGVREK